jgi:hypothetical protein
LPRRAIVRATNGLYVQTDGPFWLLDGRVYELFATGASGDDVVFRTEPYEFWSVRYTPSTEQWTVIKSDGTTYVYGGSDAAEQGVHWGAWVGTAVADAPCSARQRTMSRRGTSRLSPIFMAAR